jgi:hypothetical protein
MQWVKIHLRGNDPSDRLQASGKSTFYKQRFAATHALVSKDLLRTINIQRAATGN